MKESSNCGLVWYTMDSLKQAVVHKDMMLLIILISPPFIYGSYIDEDNLIQTRH